MTFKVTGLIDHFERNDGALGNGFTNRHQIISNSSVRLVITVSMHGHIRCQLSLPSSVQTELIPTHTVAVVDSESDVRVIQKVFFPSGGEARGVWLNIHLLSRKKKAILGCGLSSRRTRGRGLTPLLLYHWWKRGTKIPVPAAGKQTDTRHCRDGLLRTA